MGIIKKVTDALGEDGFNLAKVAGQQFLGQTTEEPSAGATPSGPAHSAPPPPPTGSAVPAGPSHSVAPPTSIPASVSSTVNGSGDVVDGLHKLGEMYKAGLLTEDEFAQAKTRLLG